MRKNLDGTEDLEKLKTAQVVEKLSAFLEPKCPSQFSMHATLFPVPHNPLLPDTITVLPYKLKSPKLPHFFALS